MRWLHIIILVLANNTQETFALAGKFSPCRELRGPIIFLPFYSLQGKTWTWYKLGSETGCLVPSLLVRMILLFSFFFFFTDNFILFVETSLIQVDIFNIGLDNFCNGSSHTVNRDKTRIYFSKNMSGIDRRQLNRSLGLQRQMTWEIILKFPCFIPMSLKGLLTSSSLTRSEVSLQAGTLVNSLWLEELP